MKIIYGKGICSLNNSIEPVESIVIRYRGKIVIQHQFAELYNIIDNNFYFRNLKSKSLLVHGNNQIHIGFAEGRNDLEELFKYVGEFRILSVKVNNKSITVEARGIDYYNLIDSTWDYAGKPEKYNGTYTIGKVPKNKRNKVLTTGVKRQKGNGGY